jgi:HlyD family secretion protein
MKHGSSCYYKIVLLNWKPKGGINMNSSWFIKNKKTGLIVVILFLGILISWFLYTKGPLGPPKVFVATAEKQAFTAGVFGIGTVDAKLTYAIGPIQAGRVLKVYADQGDKVSEGKVLGEMDPVDLEQKVIAASASIAKSNSALTASQALTRDTASRRKLTQITAKRYQSLYAANAVSREVVDIKNNEANAAMASHDSAVAAMESARGEVSRATAEYSALISQRNNLKLISPVNGLVISRDAEPGATVVAGQSVFRLIDPSTIWIRTRIDQAQFQGISVGQTAKIVLRSSPDKIFAGKVARLEVQADSVTEERFVNVVFDVIPGILPLGELAEVTIQFLSIPDATVVSAAAIKKRDRQYGVWLLKNDKLQFQPVEIGAYSLEGKVHIRNGLDPGNTIVVYSSQQLEDGMKVRTEKSHD